MYIRKDDIKPFESQVWLSSPTMHGDEIKYVDAYFLLHFDAASLCNVCGV